MGISILMAPVRARGRIAPNRNPSYDSTNLLLRIDSMSANLRLIRIPLNQYYKLKTDKNKLINFIIPKRVFVLLEICKMFRFFYNISTMRRRYLYYIPKILASLIV